MKIVHSLKAGRQGFALVMVIFFSALAVMALAGVMQWSSNTSQLNERSNRLGQAIGAAEAATEKVITQLAYDFRVNDEPMVYSRLSRYSSMVPSTTESSEWNNYTFSDAQGSSTRTYVTRVSSNGFASVAQYAGLSGFSSTYRVISNVREGAGSGPAITAAVQQEIQLITIPIFQFAIFYSGDMEFIGSAAMNISGPVHGNANMYTGGGSPVTFGGEVTTTGIITNSGGYLWGATVTTTYNGARLRTRPA